jgi:hypothetical protein
MGLPATESPAPHQPAQICVACPCSDQVCWPTPLVCLSRHIIGHIGEHSSADHQTLIRAANRYSPGR